MKKIEAKRREQFLSELACCGNITLAAERARVSAVWATRLRRADPAFRALSEDAIAAAHRRLQEHGNLAPPSRWRTQNGHQLIVQHGHGRFVQVRRARRKQWTKQVEARFLSALAQSCNVRMAVAAAETTIATVYRHRRRWPDFAERWDAALEQGYDRLSTLIVANGCKMLGDEDVVPEVEMPDMTVAAALQALSLYRRQIRGDGARSRGRWRRPPSLDEVRASILRKLECVVRASEEAAEEADVAAGDRGDG